MIRVLITDDYRLWRLGVRALLAREHDIEVVGEARDGQEAIQQAEQLSPDVVLMDIQMPLLNGLQATEQILARQPNIRVVLFAMALDEPLVRQALQLGAVGYLPKDCKPEELVAAIRAVHASKTYFDPRVSKWLAHDTASL